MIVAYSSNYNSHNNDDGDWYNDYYMSCSNVNNNNIAASLLGSGFQGLFGQSVQEFEAKLDSAGLNKITLQLISHKIDPSTYA